MMTKKIEDDQGSIGIGAMIVFIALILVAAVASAVIIQTAETLQQNAQSVGDDTQAEIAGKVQLHGAFYAAAGNDVHLIFSLAPGSGTLLLTSIKVQIFCNVGGVGAAAFAQDAGDFDDEAVTELSGAGATTPGAAGNSVQAGTKYFISFTLATCVLDDINAGWANGDHDGSLTMYIHVDGGGSTMEILDASGSLNEGDSVL